MSHKEEPKRTGGKSSTAKMHSTARPVKDDSRGKNGSIVRFHRSVPLADKMHEAIPTTLEHTNQPPATTYNQDVDRGLAAAKRPTSKPFEKAVTAEKQESDLAVSLVVAVAKNNPDVNTLCKVYQLRREELGRLTGFSLRALAEWASGKLPSHPAKRRLHEVRRLLDALSKIVKLESIPDWLHQPNQAFGDLTPLQAIEVGEIDRLWSMVHDLNSGQSE